MVKGKWEEGKEGMEWKPEKRRLPLEELGTVNWGQFHEGNFGNLDYGNFQVLRKGSAARTGRWLAILAMFIN